MLTMGFFASCFFTVGDTLPSALNLGGTGLAGFVFATVEASKELTSSAAEPEEVVRLVSGSAVFFLLLGGATGATGLPTLSMLIL